MGVELAMPASEPRLVQTDDFNETGRVYRELADATLTWADAVVALDSPAMGPLIFSLNLTLD
ncbi:hypothetical protein, partial [Micromonospora sp. MH33]|uniref:hypothetical protein n=1 Tax=Micromonospora sp. MH33 TaxID=1945509 RepID=UPI0011B219C4